MSVRIRGKGLDEDERTGRLTGTDASMDEAEIGDAGNGADYYGADLTGGPPRSIEDDPDKPDDIVPDRIERFESAPLPEDVEVTAQPSDEVPIEPSEFP